MRQKRGRSTSLEGLGPSGDGDFYEDEQLWAQFLRELWAALASVVDCLQHVEEGALLPHPSTQRLTNGREEVDRKPTCLFSSSAIMPNQKLGTPK